MSTAFSFRLQPVLEHRTRREERAQQELSEALAALARQQEAAVVAERVHESHVEHLRVLSRETSELWRLRAGHEAMVAARRRALHERDQCERLDEVARARRDDLVRAAQDREALSQLERRQRERHRKEELRLEAVALDEIAVQRHRSSGFGARPATDGNQGMVLMP